MAYTKKKEENNETKGNVILLTVIALATMIVVVIGATFAYLANSVDDFDSSNIGASTQGTADMFLISAGKDINIMVGPKENEDDPKNDFSPGSGDEVDSAIATVTLQRAVEEAITYKYSVYVNVAKNDFEYTSGTCYASLTPEASKVDYASCTASANHVWGTQDGNTYSCYSYTNYLDSLYMNGSSTFANEIACTSQNGTIWGSEHTPELYMDFYKSNESDSTTCATAGVCVNSTSRQIVDGVTTQQACVANSNQTWMPNTYDDATQSCFSLIAVKDLTEVRPAMNGDVDETREVVILENEAITAGKTAVSHKYKAVVTLRNFNHNQIINTNKKFSATLNFQRETD